jgi:DNA-binding transcriptional regulator YiaG
MSKIHSGKTISEEHKAIISAANKGKKLSKRHLKIMSKIKRGENNFSAKLNPWKVRVIRKINKLTQQEISNIFGVSRVTISRIRSRKLWRHI